MRVLISFGAITRCMELLLALRISRRLPTIKSLRHMIGVVVAIIGGTEMRVE